MTTHISSTEIIGTSSTLGNLRLGASRLGAAPGLDDIINSNVARDVVTGGVNAWTHQNTGPRTGHPAGSVDKTGWTTALE